MTTALSLPFPAPLVYLAGPDVFAPEPLARGLALKALCAQWGFEGLYPLDGEPAPQGPEQSLSIWRANCALIDRAEAVLANLRPFRGAEPDSGTVWEVAYAHARGKPVVGYLPDARAQRDRLAVLAPGGVDSEGWAVEDFGLPLNLMIVHSLSGLVYGPEDGYQGFQAALACLAARLGRANLL
jgi:nucleoside 2-deoxyribosyltransferase